MPVLTDFMQRLGQPPLAPSDALGLAATTAKNQALSAAAAAILAHKADILAANVQDLARARERQLSAALLDRLALNDNRVEAMAKGLTDIIQLADPIGTVMAQWTRPNGLDISRVRVPLG